MNLQERTKGYPLKQLIKILYLKEDYNNEAVAAAEAELDKRDVSQEEVDEILKEVELEDERNSTPNTLQKAENAIGEAIPVSSKFLNPFVKKEVPELLKGVAVFLTLVPLVDHLFSRGMINSPEGLLSIIYTPIDLSGPLIFPILGSIFLWKMKDFGWYAAVFALIYMVVTEGILFSWYFMNSDMYPLSFILFKTIIWGLVCIMLYTLYQKRVLTFLSIEKNAFWIVTGVSILWAAMASVGLVQILFETLSQGQGEIELLSQ